MKSTANFPICSSKHIELMSKGACAEGRARMFFNASMVNAVGITNTREVPAIRLPARPGQGVNHFTTLEPGPPLVVYEENFKMFQPKVT